MNCNCQGQLPAACLTVRQSNSDNFGRQFFACQTRTCGFFQFADEPASSSSYNGSSSSSFNQHFRQGVQSSSSSKSATSIKLYLDEFDESSFQFWFAVCPVNAEISKIIQNLPANKYKYNNGLKLWLLEFTLYETFVDILNTPPCCYNIEEIPKFVVQGIRSFLKSTPNFLVDPEIDISPTLSESLLSFQLQGIKFVVKRNGRALIADEMGCGKVSHSLPACLVE